MPRRQMRSVPFAAPPAAGPLAGSQKRVLAKLPLGGKRVGVILSGGNADLQAVAEWLRAERA